MCVKEKEGERESKRALRERLAMSGDIFVVITGRGGASNG